MARLAQNDRVAKSGAAVNMILNAKNARVIQQIIKTAATDGINIKVNAAGFI
jgi:hypothetical protein